MKAQVIFDAMEAMKEAEDILLISPGAGAFHAYRKLMTARIDLMFDSGLREVEIPVETEPA